MEERFIDLGKLDLNIYRSISAEIQSEEVIITCERIEHIKERHPDDYALFEKYGRVVLAEPDYILKSKRASTGVVLKQIKTNGIMMQLVLKIATSQESGKKNSVITFMKISERTWNKYMRNKEIIYKNH